MKKFLLILLSCLGLAACKTSKVTKPPVDENALLWKISGKNLTRPSYLYGTIHMICASDFVISDSLSAAFQRSNKIYLELDMDDPAMDAKMLKLSINKGKKLSDIFSKEDYAKLNTFFRDSIGMPLALLNPLKPFTLLSLIYLKGLPCTQQESYEMNFVKMAKAQNKEINGLESLEDQFAVFDNIPEKEQAKMIMDLVNNFHEQKGEFERMVANYKAQNLTALQDEIEQSPDMKGQEEALLINRNKNWIPRMEGAMQGNSILFAVGAGHLGGDFGVIKLLRDKGYKLTPIK
jgi:uncharacterized protein YbaP (TraB family)